MFHFPQLYSDRTFKSVIMMALVVILLLAACGGDDEPTPTTAPATAAPTTAPAAPESPLQPESPLPSSNNAEDAQPATASGINPAAMDYTMAQPEISKSEADTGTVVGRLVSTTTDVPLNHEIVRLAEVECPEDVAQESKRTECVWMLSNAFSPSTFTDENGFFTFNDVTPRDYVVIVGDMMNKNTKLADEDGPFMWAAVGNEITDIGEYRIEW